MRVLLKNIGTALQYADKGHKYIPGRGKKPVRPERKISFLLGQEFKILLQYKHKVSASKYTCI